MSMFDKRKQGEEGKFARDQELVFKAKVRRNRMLGLWLAENFLSLSGADFSFVTARAKGSTTRTLSTSSARR